MAANTASIEQVANCVEAFAESRREIERLCLALTRECKKAETLSEYVKASGNTVSIDDEAVAVIQGTIGDVVDFMAVVR